MPVVQGVELRCDAVLVLEALVEEQLGIKLEFEVIATQMLHIVFNHNLDGLTYRINVPMVYMILGTFKLPHIKKYFAYCYFILMYIYIYRYIFHSYFVLFLPLVKSLNYLGNDLHVIFRKHAGKFSHEKIKSFPLYENNFSRLSVHSLPEMLHCVNQGFVR